MRRRRLAAIGLLVAVGLIGWALSSGSDTQRPARRVVGGAGAGARRAGALHVALRQIGELPEALQDAAAAPDPSDASVLLFGGLSAEEASSAEILRIDPASGAAASAGTLPAPVHDACAAAVGGADYLFGGGQTSSYSGILLLAARAGASQVGTLPTPASDVACAVLGGTAYVVGGYTGTEPLRSILAWQPGQAPRVAGRLPKPLRYAAVGAVEGRVLIAGGTSGTAASSEVYVFDPATGAVRPLATLPAPLTHATGVALDGALLVIGGRGGLQGTQTSTVLSVSPSGRVTSAGRLSLALSDVSAAPVAGGAVLAGGLQADGSLSRAIWRLSLSAR